MAKTIFDLLYNGEFNLAARGVIRSLEQEEIEQKIATEKSHLTKLLSPEDWKRFEELENLFGQASDFEKVDDFAFGVMLGVLVMQGVDEKWRGIVSGVDE